MAESTPLSKTSQVWEKKRIWECLSSGNEEKFSWLSSKKDENTYFLSKCEGGAKCIQIDSNGNAEVTGRIDVEEDPLCSLTSSSSTAMTDVKIFTAHKSGLVRQWIGNELKEPPQGQVAFKTDHKGPILQMRVLSNGEKYNELVTVGSDYTIKLWNIETRHCLSVLRGITSVPLCTEIFENIQRQMCYLACGLVDGTVKLWKMKRDEEISCWMVPSSSVMATTLAKHHSQVPTLQFVASDNHLWLVTCGRDQLIAVWDLSTNPEMPNCIKLIPTMEEVERIIPVSPKFIRQISVAVGSKKSSKQLDIAKDDHYCLTGGQKGIMRLWNVSLGREVTINGLDIFGFQNKIFDIFVTEDEKHLYLLQDDIISHVNFDIETKSETHTISLTSTNQYEVLDFTIINDYLIVATTSNILKVYEFSDKSHGRLLCASSDQNGHSDAILAVTDVIEEEKRHIITCGKDQSVCLWKIHNEENKFQLEVIAKGLGHSSYVGAVAGTNKAIFSASKDGVLKLWGWLNDNEEIDNEKRSLTSRRNIAAHASEINSLAVSPDAEILASGSQDKLVKLWRTDDLALISTLSGHRRGIWCTKFFFDSSLQQVILVTASADSNVKLWKRTTANSYICIHTLEGHLSSVLSVTPLPALKGGGTKLATVSSDGLLKIWSSENNWVGDVGSFDAHDDKIWAVTCVEQDKILTGGRDGQMILWENVTQVIREQERLKAEELIKFDQRLNNYLINGKLSKALKLALKMGKPRLTKKTLHTLQKRGELDIALQKLSIDERNILFQSLVQWNSFASQSSIVQDILKFLITDSLVNGQSISADQCAGLIAYSEKHYQRLDKLQSRLSVVDLLLDTM